MIVDGELLPGARLPVEKDLAARFVVSRGSLREGIRALSHLGVLETKQGSGTFVSTLLPALLLAPVEFMADLQPGSSVRELQAVRRLLETGAIRACTLRITEDEVASAQRAIDAGAAAVHSERGQEAALEADMEFHRILAAASGNSVLSSLINALSGRTARGRLWRALVDTGAATRAVEEHREILDAVRTGDPEVAAVRMAAHLLSVELFLHREESNTVNLPGTMAESSDD